MPKKDASSSRFRFLSAVFDRSRGAVRSDDGNDGSEGTEKNAYTRRREQIRRAQRKHRERKEDYIRHLESRILEFREDIALRQDYQEASIENSVLRDILFAHKISIPSSHQQHSNPGGWMQVSVVGTPAQPHMLHARLSPISFGDSSHQDSSFAQSGDSLAMQMQKASMLPNAILPQVTSSPENAPTKSHPHGLDSTQTGVDFVLLLEKPCLQHTMHPLQAGESHGHALTLQASLLSHAPHLGADEGSWAVPAVEFDRLFELSRKLDLDGEITPVQAWNQIKSHSRFQDLTPAGLEALQKAISSKISCFGFGAVIEEFELSDIMEAHLGK
ncbi:hypothetical protein PISL3812_00433 [Talaromyces islandicus]|uniref:BZIP domain-containing protein n=1 Tax=Talaromyces islandicus TaxID=28573 RepID=A0A0U1LJE1_TALIS|nr:hypothetical protein PISL3812_00433 [Talaromyces islandicus]